VSPSRGEIPSTDLQHHLVTIGQHHAVDLRHRCRGQRLGIEMGKRRFRRLPQALFHRRTELDEGQRRRPTLKLSSSAVHSGESKSPHVAMMSELYEGRTQCLQHEARARRQ
jgi:hypothetical protein